MEEAEAFIGGEAAPRQSSGQLKPNGSLPKVCPFPWSCNAVAACMLSWVQSFAGAVLCDGAHVGW